MNTCLWKVSDSPIGYCGSYIPTGYTYCIYHAKANENEDWSAGPAPDNSPSYFDTKDVNSKDDKDTGKEAMQTFDTGATRSADTDKIDYEGFLSPLVLERFGQYMLKHQYQADGSLRSSDNWQKGIPLKNYMKSMWRHFMSVWKSHRGSPSVDGLEDDLCGLLFNVQGYMHEVLKNKRESSNGSQKNP